MKQSTMKTFLVFIFIIILTVFFIYSPSRLAPSTLAANRIEKFTGSQDSLLISYTDYLYAANTKEIFIDQTYKNTNIFSNATIDGISKDYIVDDTIYIDAFNYNYFDYKILIGNKSIEIYLDKTRPRQLQFFYYYTGEKPGVVRFYESDGSMDTAKTKHNAVNSFLLMNNTDNSVGTAINYIFAYDVIEGRPNVNYKVAQYMNTKNGTKPPTTDIQEQNEPYEPLDLSTLKPKVDTGINEIDCSLSLIGNSDMTSLINGTTSCTVKTKDGGSNILNVPFSAPVIVPSPKVPSSSPFYSPTPSTPYAPVLPPALAPTRSPINVALAPAPAYVSTPSPVYKSPSPSTFAPSPTPVYSVPTYGYTPTPSPVYSVPTYGYTPAPAPVYSVPTYGYTPAPSPSPVYSVPTYGYTPTPAPPTPTSSVIVSKQITGTGSNIININNVDVIGTSTDGYNVFAFTTPNNTNANILVNLSQSQVMNVFLVGGGGNGGWGSGGGGGAGGIVSQTVTLPAGNYTISVSVGNTGRSGGSRDTTITSSDGKINYIARAGGDSTGFNPGGSRPGNGGSGAGAAWGGTMGKAGMSGIQSQYGNTNADGYRSTIWAAGTGNTADYNIANPGGKGMANSDVQYNNFNCGNGGGGGAGSPGGDASLIQNIGGNDQDGNPIGPIKCGKGGDGILCTLPGIKNFTYNGKNWGQLYWAGGGGAGFSGYTYTHNAPLDYSKPTVSADGGKGGGGGGEGPWLTSDRNGPRASGKDDTNGLNPANNNNAYYLNSGKNTGGAGGLNTGGGGGGGYDSGYGGEGGSGIAIFSVLTYGYTPAPAPIRPPVQAPTPAPAPAPISQELTIPLAPILTFTSATTSSITFSFPQQNASVTYTAAVNTDDANNTSITTFNTSGSPSSYTIGNLPNGNQGYKIVITATNRIGSTASSPLRAVTLPYPTNFTSFTVPSATDGTHPGNNWMQINYTNATTNGGSITQYKITTVNTTASPNVTTNPIVTGSPFYVGSLTSNALYNFTIVATHSFTNASGTVTTQTSTSGTYYKWTLPDAPSVTGTTQKGPYGMLVNFNTVSGPNGAGSTTSYVGYYNGVESSVKRAISPVDVHGLGAGGNYNFTVAAVNPSGYSAQSNSINASTTGTSSGFNRLLFYYNFEQDSTNINNNTNSQIVTGNTGWTPNGGISFPGNPYNNCTVSTTAAKGSHAVKFSEGPSFTVGTRVSTSWKGYSICFWFNAFSQQPNKSRLLNDSDGLELTGNFEKGDYYYFNDRFLPGTSANRRVSDTHFNYNQWYHFGLVWDGKGNAFNTYVNGVFIDTTYFSDGTNPSASDLGKRFYFGGTESGDYPQFAGNFMNNAGFDEIQGYNVVLNQTEIAWIMNNSGNWLNY